MKVNIIVFPGSNCDHDIFYTYARLGAQVQNVWHRETQMPACDLVVIPGGFSYGDYLRTGALAKISPVMQPIKKFADAGGQVLGICNGFQILCEAGLLPGVLLQNIGRRFLSQFVTIKVENVSNFLTSQSSPNTLITCPIAHFDGNFFADQDTIKQMEDKQQIVFRYTNTSGTVDHANRLCNPNGSINSIAGISNASGNVVGLMPHPERAFEKLVGNIAGDQGRALFA